MWWVVIPQVDQGKPAGYLELVDFRVQYDAGSAGDKAMRAGKPYADANLGQTVVKWKGPFTTEDQAKKAQAPRQQSPNPASDLVTAAKNSNLTGLAAIGDFFNKLGQAATWIRVAEVAIGAALIIVGVAKLAGGTTVGKAATRVGKAASLL